MIQFDQVSKHYQQKKQIHKAIDQLSLKIEKGESFGIIGESGAGKSTLLRLINALESAGEGKVLINEQDIQSFNKKKLRKQRKKISMIFQSFNLLNNKTVEENIHLPLELYDYPETISMDQVLEFVGLLDKRTNYPNELSGGEKQRVGIARALISRPKILLADEPTSSLDLTTSQEIVDVLKRAHAEFGMTIVTVSHDLEVIKSLASRAAILEAGKLTDLIFIQSSTKENKLSSYRERALEVLSYGDS